VADNYHSFELDGVTYLAASDHELPSALHRWNASDFRRAAQRTLRDLRSAFVTFSDDTSTVMVRGQLPVRFRAALRLGWAGSLVRQTPVLDWGKGRSLSSRSSTPCPEFFSWFGSTSSPAGGSAPYPI